MFYVYMRHNTFLHAVVHKTDGMAYSRRVTLERLSSGYRHYHYLNRDGEGSQSSSSPFTILSP